MDKKVFHQIYIKSLKENFLKGLRFFTETVFGVFCCFLGVYITFSLAKSGSDLFYYAMAFASPVTAIEFFSEPAPEKETGLSLKENFYPCVAPATAVPYQGDKAPHQTNYAF